MMFTGWGAIRVPPGGRFNADSSRGRFQGANQGTKQQVTTVFEEI